MKKENSNIFTLTKKAIKKIKKTKKYQKNPKINFRINIKSGGCNGFQYNFKFDKNKKKKDILIIQNNIKIIINYSNIKYLMGSTIDFIENFNESKFIIINPKATSICSCGSSFGI